MAKSKPILFKSNINALIKVRNQLSYSQTMNSTLVMLSVENNDKKIKAIALIRDAIILLSDIN
jgi:hypothetical protein